MRFLVRVAVKRAQARAYQFRRQAQRPRGGDRGQHGFRRHQRRQGQGRHVVGAGGHDDAAGALEHHALAGRAVRGDGGQLLVDAVEDHFAVAQLGHRHHLRIGRVEHRHAARQDHVDLRAQHVEQLVLAADVEFGQFVETADVRDDADGALVVGQAFGQDHLRAALKHGRFDVLVQQQALAGFPGAEAVLRQQAAVQEQAIGAGQAGLLAADLQQPSDQPRGHRRAVFAGDADDGHAAGFVVREQMVDDGRADRARFAAGRAQMRQQAGTGVDFDDGAALFGQRPRNVVGDDIDAGDVEADHARGQRGHRRHFGMDLIGDVEADVAVGLDQHLLAVQRHGIRGQALALQFEDDLGAVFRRQRVQRRVFGGAATRVGVDLLVDQPDDVGAAVAGHPQRLARGGRDQPLADHQQAVLVAGDEALDDDALAAALARSQRVGGLDVGLRHQVQRDAAAVVAVVGLDDHRHADVLRRFPGRFGAGDQLAFGHGHAAGGQQRLGQVLVAGDAFGDGAGFFGLGGPDAALHGAVAQLHQVAVGQADRGNLAHGGGVDDVGGARPQAYRLDQVGQVDDGGGQVVGFIFDHRHQQVAAGGQRGASDLLLAGAEGHLVQAGAVADLARLAEAGLDAGQVLQFQHHVFEDVAGVGAVAQAFEEAAVLADAAAVDDQIGQPSGQTLIQAGQLI